MEVRECRQGGVILLVDDDEGVRDLLTEVLTRQGYQVVSHANGEEALCSYREAPPELLITDIDMPLMNGLELIRSIRSSDTSLPIMAISGDAGHLIAAENLGAMDSFIKPLDIKRLRDAVCDVLG